MSTPSYILTLFGVQINLVTIALVMGLLGILYLFWRIQADDKLDFADLITANGKSVSLTKVLQLVGGVTGTWVVIKLALANTITGEIFMIYLAYVASIEGFSKFITAKYSYKEGSVRDYYHGGHGGRVKEEPEDLAARRGVGPQPPLSQPAPTLPIEGDAMIEGDALPPPPRGTRNYR